MPTGKTGSGIRRLDDAKPVANVTISGHSKISLCKAVDF